MRKDRNRHGGGVCIYLRSTINYKPRADLEADNIEALCIEILKPNSKPFAVISCYRPPNSNVDQFFNSLSTLIERLDHEDKELYILGDLNCNFIAEQKDHPTNKLIQLSEDFQLTQLINEPNRITEKSRTLIDVVLTNTRNRVADSGVLHLGISDHSLIYVIRKISIPFKTRPTMTTVRQFKHFNSTKFKEELGKQAWANVSNHDDPNDMWSLWKHTFLHVVDKHAPPKLKRVRNKKSPWITTAVRNLIINKTRLKKIAIRSNNPEDWTTYKKARNTANNEIRKAKATYYQTHFKENSGNSRETWKTINQVMSRNVRTNNITGLKSENTTATDPKEMAEIFNKYFTEIGPKLASKLNEAPKPFEEYLTTAESTFQLKTIDTATVLK